MVGLLLVIYTIVQFFSNFRGNRGLFLAACTIVQSFKKNTFNKSKKSA